MFWKRKYAGVFCLVILIVFVALTRPAAAQSGSHLDLDFHRVPWTHLSFFAKNFWVEVLTDIELSSVPSSHLDPLLLKSPRGTPIKPETAKSAQMAINTIIDARFRSPVNIHNSIWFNPTDGSALGRIRLRRGEDDFKKMYRFTEQGVFRHRIEPKDNKEASLEPEKWTDIKDSFYPYDLTRLGCIGISEPSLLIYILSAAAISKSNESISLCVFGKRQLHHVCLQKLGISVLDVNYIEENQQTKVRKQARIKTLKFAITAESLESEQNKAENFSFLGFHKDIIIYIEPAKGIPVQASGIISTIGKAELKLKQILLNPATD